MLNAENNCRTITFENNGRTIALRKCPCLALHSSLVLLHGHEKIGHPFGNGGPLSIDLPFSEIIWLKAIISG